MILLIIFSVFCGLFTTYVMVTYEDDLSWSLRLIVILFSFIPIVGFLFALISLGILIDDWEFDRKYKRKR